MIIRRLFQPSITQNEKESNYKITSLSSSEVENLLSTKYTGGGIFGIEYYKSSNYENTVFFCQPHFKLNWEECKREISFDELSKEESELTTAQFFTEKSSIFPIKMDCDKSILTLISSSLPLNLELMYQLLIVYRQDRWIDRLDNQYLSYLDEGVEQPSNSQFLLNIQRNISRKIEEFLKWENKRYPIPEFYEKVKENGFRINLRVIVKGGTKNQRKQTIEDINNILNEYSYLNNWGVLVSGNSENVLEDIKNRRLDNNGKQQVFCESELLPFLVIESNNLKNDNVTSETSVENEKVMLTETDSILELLPKGKGLKTIDTNEHIKKFNKALKKVKDFRGELVCNNSIVGTTLIKLYFTLPKNIRFSDLTKKSNLDDLRMYFGNKHLTIEQGDINEFVVNLPVEERQSVYLGDYLDSEEFIRFSKESELPIIIGVSETGEPIIKDLVDLRSLLVVGTMGSGKSVEINSIILSLLLSRNPSDVNLFLIDVKQVEFPIFRKFNHVSKIISDADESILLLKQLISEMNRRYSLLEKAEVKNIMQYNKKYPNKKMQYLVVICDEYAELTMRNSDVHDYIQSLAQLGRAAGVIPIIASQFSTVDIIPSVIKNNLATKIAFRLAHSRSYLTIFNTKPPFDLLGKGDGVISMEGSLIEHVRFQGCLITDDDEGVLINKIAKRMKEEKVIFELPEVIEEENELDKLKRIIIENNECRISRLQKLMKININKLNDLMRELCEEGFLKAPEYKSQGYQLIADEDTINKYKEKLPQP